MYTVFSRLNALGVCLKFGSFDPAFFRGRRLIGVRRLSMKCDFQPFSQVDSRKPRGSLSVLVFLFVFLVTGGGGGVGGGGGGSFV